MPIEVTGPVTMLPRGHRWEMGGRSFVALGGAPSLQRPTCPQKSIDWWPSEVIREEHVEATIAGGYAEDHAHSRQPWPALLHRSPSSDIIAGNPLAWPEDILAYADEGIEKVTRAVSGRSAAAAGARALPRGGRGGASPCRAPSTTPSLWSLAARHDPGNIRLLDLDTLTEPCRRPDGVGRRCSSHEYPVARTLPVAPPPAGGGVWGGVMVARGCGIPVVDSGGSSAVLPDWSRRNRMAVRAHPLEHPGRTHLVAPAGCVLSRWRKRQSAAEVVCVGGSWLGSAFASASWSYSMTWSTSQPRAGLVHHGKTHVWSRRMTCSRIRSGIA